MNTVVLSGKVVADAKVFNKPGFDVVTFQLENTIGFGNQKKTSVFNIKKFGKKVGNVAKFLVAGRNVEVIGKLAVETFQQNGSTKSVVVIAATEIELGWLPKEKNQQGDDFNSDFDGDAQSNDQEPENNYFG